MMKKGVLLLSMLLCGSCMISNDIAAQNDVDGVKIVKTSDADKDIMKAAKPKHPFTPKVPNFVLKEGNGKFIMGLGGFIQPIVGWDLGNVMPSMYFIPSIIPVPAVKGQKSEFFSRPFNSALDLQVIALPGQKDQVVGYVKVQFGGPQRAVQLTEAYVQYRGITMGRSFSVFTDCAAMPNTIDPQGPNGASCAYAYITSYTSKSYSGFNYSLSLELPTFDNTKGIYNGKDYPDLDNSQIYGSASQSVPDAIAYLQYAGKNSNNRVRVSGIVRNFRYRDLVKDDTRNVMGWGVMLSGNLQPCKPLILYYEGTYGQGIGNYIQDLSGLPMSYIPKDNMPGKMKAAPMFGFLGGATINFTPKLQSNLMFSEARAWDTGSYYSNYKYGLYGTANLFYNITPYLQYGIEYQWGKHSTFTDGSSTVNRIQTTLMFTL